MAQKDRTKTALDESRMLMLGAQILLGFQFQAPFQDAFAQLSKFEKSLEMAVVLLMIVVIGLVIAPSARHRIVYDGIASASFDQFVSQITAVILAPFIFALAIDLGIAVGRMGGTYAAWFTGLGSLFACTILWYVPALLSRRGKPVATSDEKTPLEAKIDYVLTEARVILPGAQAMLGFQLAIVLTSGFGQLPEGSKTMHGVALGLIAIATVLLISPAVFHRVVYKGENEPRFHRLASWLLLISTIFLAGGLAADSYVVALKISGDASVATALALSALIILLALWIVWPWKVSISSRRHRRTRS